MYSKSGLRRNANSVSTGSDLTTSDALASSTPSLRTDIELRFRMRSRRSGLGPYGVAGKEHAVRTTSLLEDLLEAC